MNKEKIIELFIKPKQEQEEKIIGYFQSMNHIAFWRLVIFGVFAQMRLRAHIVVVSERGLYIHKLTFLGKPDQETFFPWQEINNIEFGKTTFFQSKMEISFFDQMKKKIALKAQVGGVKKLAKLDEQTKKYIENKFIHHRKNII